MAVVRNRRKNAFAGLYLAAQTDNVYPFALSNNVYLFALSTELKRLSSITMPRPRQKTAATSLKMTSEVRDLWEQCAAAERRSLTNMFEVMVRNYAKKLELDSPAHSPAPIVRTSKTTPKKH